LRLANVERGDGLKPRVIFKIIRMVSGYRAPDVIRTLMYRRAFFGGTFATHSHEVMRGPSPWTVGERELFAAFVSDRNKCRF
jgi:hypothetical protein